MQECGKTVLKYDIAKGVTVHSASCKSALWNNIQLIITVNSYVIMVCQVIAYSRSQTDTLARSVTIGQSDSR